MLKRLLLILLLANVISSTINVVEIDNVRTVNIKYSQQTCRDACNSDNCQSYCRNINSKMSLYKNTLICDNPCYKQNCNLTEYSYLYWNCDFSELGLLSLHVPVNVTKAKVKFNVIDINFYDNEDINENTKFINKIYVDKDKFKVSYILEDYSYNKTDHRKLMIYVTKKYIRSFYFYIFLTLKFIASVIAGIGFLYILSNY